MNNADHVDRQERIRMLEEGRTALGIELGSTRIKAVLIDESRTPLASGGFGWENRCEAVSYTHLDVYKRQMRRLVMAGGKFR